jgi:hypothetical protein
MTETPAAETEPADVPVEPKGPGPDDAVVIVTLQEGSK